MVQGCFHSSVHVVPPAESPGDQPRFLVQILERRHGDPPAEFPFPVCLAGPAVTRQQIHVPAEIRFVVHPDFREVRNPTQVFQKIEVPLLKHLVIRTSPHGRQVSQLLVVRIFAEYGLLLGMLGQVLISVFHESGKRRDLEAVFLCLPGHRLYGLFVPDPGRYRHLVVTQAGHLRNFVHKGFRPVPVVLKEGDPLYFPLFHEILPCDIQ